MDRTNAIDVPCWGFAVRDGNRIAVLEEEEEEEGEDEDDEDVLDVGVGEKRK